jgi:hypothetical protein
MKRLTDITPSTPHTISGEQAWHFSKFHRFTVHFDSLSFFTPTDAPSHTTTYQSFKSYQNHSKHFRNHSNMLRSSMRSSSGSFFISLSMPPILKIIKISKKDHHSVVVMRQHMSSVRVMRTVWRRELSSSRLHTVRITGTLNICCHITTTE